MVSTWLHGEQEMLAGAGQLLLFRANVADVVITGVDLRLHMVGMVLELTGEVSLVRLEGLSNGNDMSEVDDEEIRFTCLHLELHKVTGKVFVDALMVLGSFKDFFLISFLFSALRVLISDLRVLMLSERFSFFCSLL